MHQRPLQDLFHFVMPAFWTNVTPIGSSSSSLPTWNSKRDSLAVCLFCHMIRGKMMSASSVNGCSTCLRVYYNSACVFCKAFFAQSHHANPEYRSYAFLYPVRSEYPHNDKRDRTFRTASFAKYDKGENDEQIVANDWINLFVGILYRKRQNL